MLKRLPKPLLYIIPTLLVVIVIAGALIIRGRNSESEVEEEPKPKEIPVADLPFVQLFPYADKHRLDINVTNIKAPRIGYQIIYTFEYKGQQVERGFGGRDIKLEGKTEFIRAGEQAVVFGSESSGKFKYDEGVENGSFEITYRDEKGKATGAAETKWHLQDATKITEFTSPDTNLTFKPAGKLKGTILTMHTMGLPTAATGTVLAGPYGVFASDNQKLAGSLAFKLTSDSPAKLVGYDPVSKSWKDIQSSQAGSELTASPSSFQVFAVVSQ